MLGPDHHKHAQNELALLRMDALRSGDPEKLRRCEELERGIALLSGPSVRVIHGSKPGEVIANRTSADLAT